MSEVRFNLERSKMDSRRTDHNLCLEVMDSLIGMLEEMALRAESARLDAQERANEHAGKIESRFDTFKEEAQYLAYGQGLRRLELIQGIKLCRQLRQSMLVFLPEDSVIRPGRLVKAVSADDETRYYMIAPAGSGIQINMCKMTVMIVSTGAPVGKRLNGKEEGDDVGLPLSNGHARDWIIDKVF